MTDVIGHRTSHYIKFSPTLQMFSHYLRNRISFYRRRNNKVLAVKIPFAWYEILEDEIITLDKQLLEKNELGIFFIHRETSDEGYENFLWNGIPIYYGSHNLLQKDGLQFILEGA